MNANCTTSDELAGATFRDRWLPPLLCPLIALGIVLACTAQFPDFFFIDDAQNEMLPVCREMGRIWTSGHVPILTTNTFLGGNLLVDMVSSPFCPQIILTSLLTTRSESFRVQAGFFSWLNLTLVVLGGYWIGRLMDIRRSYSCLLGFLLATCPFFLYVFSAAWWNNAVAHAWFVLGFASLLQFRKRRAPRNFLLAVVVLACLFASGGPQAHLLYLATWLVLASFDYLEHKALGRLLPFLSIVVCGLLIAAIPLFAEYGVAGSLKITARETGFNNSGNFLVPTWTQVLMFFNPSYKGYMHWFRGYRYVPIPLGYCAIIALPLISFLDFSRLAKSTDFKIAATLCLLCLLLTQTSQQLGPTRWPMRFLPSSTMFIAILVMLCHDKGVFVFTRPRTAFYLALIGVSAYCSLFSAEGEVFVRGRICDIGGFLALGMVLLFAFRRFAVAGRSQRWLAISLWLVSGLGFLQTIVVTNTLAGPYLLYTSFDPGVSGTAPTARDNGNYVALAWNGEGQKNDICELGAAQFLAYGLKSLNGYSPVGHRGFSALFPAPTAHGCFVAGTALENLSNEVEGCPGVFAHQLFGVSTIFAWRTDVTPRLERKLKKAGLSIEPYPVGDRVLIRPADRKTPEGSLAYQSGGKLVRFEKADGMTKECFQVAPSESPQTLFFSRVYWPGYHVAIDGKELPVGSYKDALLKVVIPAGMSGKMCLSYQPVSWKYTKWLMLLGAVTLCASLWVVRKAGRERVPCRRTATSR